MLYRLRLLSVPEGEARKICQSLRRAFLQKMGLPPGTAAATADSYVWMSEQDELAVERVLMLMRLLGGGGVTTRAVGGAVRELQRSAGDEAYEVQVQLEGVVQLHQQLHRGEAREYRQAEVCKHLWVEWHLTGGAVQALQQQQAVTRRRQGGATAEGGGQVPGGHSRC